MTPISKMLARFGGAFPNCRSSTHPSNIRNDWRSILRWKSDTGMEKPWLSLGKGSTFYGGLSISW